MFVHVANLSHIVLTARELLQKAAQHLLDNSNLPEEQKVLYISLNDFRALT